MTAEMETGPRSGLRVTRLVAAPRAWVFAAFTEPVLIGRWWWPWKPAAMSDLRVGGAYRLAAEHPEAGHLEITGRYLDVRPPELLRFTWRWAGAREEEDTVATVVIVPAVGAADETEMTVVHEGFPDQATRDDHVQGWSDCLDRLALLAASPHPIDDDRNASTSAS
ncbi:MAG: SRPBCC domain-containing protein [Candidatus Limnocylindria bacterium]